MKKMRQAVVVFCALALFCVASETLENEFLRVTVSERGGRIVSLVDKATGRELVHGAETLGGCGKLVDAQYQNLELVTMKYALRREGDAVTAACRLATANLAGLRVERRFRLQPGVAAVEVWMRLRSETQANRVAPRLHNWFRFGEEAVFFLPSASGLVAVSKPDFRMQKLQLVTDAQAPWLAGLENGRGVAVLATGGGSLANLYAWAGTTMEMTFRSLELKPMAEVDAWEGACLIIPFAGRGQVTQVTPEMVVTVENGRGRAFFVRGLGRREATLGGRRLGEVDCRAGSVYEFAAAPGELRFSSASGEFAAALPAWKPRQALHKMPPRAATGVNGYYYFYPDLYLSREIDADVCFGVRGNFTRVKNPRVRILLPEGVALTWVRGETLSVTGMTVQGRRYQCHEFRPPRLKSNATSALHLNLRATEAFQKGSAGYVQLVWDGGEQPRERIEFKLIPPMPKLAAKLRHFRVMLMDISLRPVPEWNRAGVNSVKWLDWEVPIFHNARQPDDFYAARLRDWGAAGYECGTQFGLCFSRAFDVMTGKYVEGAGTFFHPKPHVVKLDLEECRAIDNLGRKTKFVCPWYRGPYFEKTLDKLKTALDYGFRYVIFDEETWGNGIVLCHCPRCLAKFGKDPAKFPKEWLEFKTDAVADIYRRFHEELHGRARLAVWVDHRVEGGAMTNRLTDVAKIGKHVEEIYPMLYHASAAYVGERTRAVKAAMKGTGARLVMGLSPNRVYEYYRVEGRNYAPLEAELQQMLEVAFNGGEGVIFWWHRGAFRGAMGFYNIARAVEMLAPVEEILRHGRQVEVPCSNPEVAVTAYEWQGRTAVFARNYDRGVVRAVVAGRPVEFKETRVAVFEVRR